LKASLLLSSAASGLEKLLYRANGELAASEMAAKWYRRELELERHAANHALERRDLAS